MQFDYTLLAEEGDECDELYELPHPEFFTYDLLFEIAIFNNFCFGDIYFVRYKGRRIMIEQYDGAAASVLEMELILSFVVQQPVCTQFRAQTI